MNILEAYKNNLVMANKSQHTIHSYVKDVTKLLSFFNISTEAEVKALSKIDIESFYAAQSNLSPTSFNGLILNLRAFFTWLDDNKTHPFFSVKFGNKRYIKVNREKKVVLSDEEVKLLIQAGANAQERFMLALMLFTAIRRDEVCNIKLSDIQDCTILINGKGGKQRKTFMNDILCTMFNVYMAERNSVSEYVFVGTRGETEGKQMTGTTVNNRVRAAAARAGLSEKITAHRLRGTRITEIIRKHGIHSAQQVAGHANLSTTALYDSTGDEIVKNALLSD